MESGYGVASQPDTAAEGTQERPKVKFFKQCFSAVTSLNSTQPLANDGIDYKLHQHHPIGPRCLQRCWQSTRQLRFQEPINARARRSSPSQVKEGTLVLKAKVALLGIWGQGAQRGTRCALQMYPGWAHLPQKTQGARRLLCQGERPG